MHHKLFLLMATAAGIGFIHTLFGPDHYLPFIVMAKARKWSILKTTTITVLCGVGHILSSVLLGVVGMLLGTAVFKLESIEAARGDVAAWMLLIFGFTYFIWGLHRAFQNKAHSHTHIHSDLSKHEHKHVHTGDHSHVHENRSYVSLTPWVLFTVFIFGPCEPLIPLLMYPAAFDGNMIWVAIVSLVFGLTTLLTMTTIVVLGAYGLSKIPLGKMHRFSHALAGLTVFLCGGAIKFLGL